MTDTQDPYRPNNPYGGLSDLTGEEPLPPLEDPGVPPAMPPRSPLLTGLIIALLLVALSVAFFQLLSGDDDTTAGGTTTTTTGDVADTVDAGPGGTTSSTTTTAATVVDFSPYEAVGEPISLADLTLTVSGIGPLEFGTPAEESIGRLVASLGEPDDDTGPRTSTGAFGVCVGDTERIVRWGPLAAIVTVDGSGETFDGYRVDISYGGAQSDAADIATLSGLRVADPVSQLESIYGSSFDISYEVDQTLGETFRLTGSSGLLLWGPVTSSEPTGSIIGIYATDVCDR